MQTYHMDPAFIFWATISAVLMLLVNTPAAKP
jgi:hypothetical protein